MEKGNFLTLLSAPAQRALKSIEATTLTRLSQYSERDLLKLHGIGPASLPVLRKALKEKGFSLKTD